MKISHNLIGNLLTLSINEHITGLTEVDTIKILIKENSECQTLKIDIIDGFVIPSALIGYLMKLINVDNKSISIVAHQKELQELLIDLKLDESFHLIRA